MLQSIMCLSKHLDKIICPDVTRFMIHVSSFDLATICMTDLGGMSVALFLKTTLNVKPVS